MIEQIDEATYYQSFRCLHCPECSSSNVAGDSTQPPFFGDRDLRYPSRLPGMSVLVFYGYGD